MSIFCRILFVTGLLLCSVSAQTVYYSQNFEGTSDMTVTGGGWEFGFPTYSFGPLTVPEGRRCVEFVLAGNYLNNATYTLTTPTISLPDSAVIKVSFNEWYV